MDCLPACLLIGVFSSLEVKEWQNGYQRSLATLVSSDSGVSHFSHLTETGLSFKCISLFQSRENKKTNKKTPHGCKDPVLGSPEIFHCLFTSPILLDLGNFLRLGIAVIFCHFKNES